MNYFDERELKADRNDLAFHVEQIRINGYTVIENVISEESASDYSKRIDKVYADQCAELGGEENLAKVGEIGVARNLVDYEASFLDLICNENVLYVVASLLGKYFTLMYQSGIVNTPNVKKYPGSWHRDLIHQNFTTSKPLAITTIYCVDHFTKENGGTGVVPFSHKLDYVPTEEFIRKTELAIAAPRGSVILLDSMLLHKTGENISTDIRRAVVNVYCLPFISQPFYFSDKIVAAQPDKNKRFIQKLLGFTNRSQSNLAEYRKKRLT